MGPVPNKHIAEPKILQGIPLLLLIVTVKLRPVKGTQRTNGEPIIEQKKETKSHVLDPRVSLPT